MKDVKGKQKAVVQPPSSNWLALKQKLPVSKSSASKRPRASTSSQPPNTLPEPEAEPIAQSSKPVYHRSKSGEEDISKLTNMILGKLPQIPAEKVVIGRYVALDCEMVGVGPPRVNERGDMETESSLARVSIVNFHGDVVLDVFVKQKEKVTDYRTFVSGVRPADLVGKSAMTFEEVQKKVADVLKDRYLVGHAVHNDLKALLLKHSSLFTRDTQAMPAIRTKYKSKRPGLRNIVKQEFGIDIQGGEHSSVIDARATMALYRVFKNQSERQPSAKATKRKRDSEVAEEASHASEEDEEVMNAPNKKPAAVPLINSILVPDPDHPEANYEPSNVEPEEPLSKVDREQESKPSRLPPKASVAAPAGKRRRKSSDGPAPGGGRKGISSGLSTIVRIHGQTVKGSARVGRGGKQSGAKGTSGGNWWAQL